MQAGPIAALGSFDLTAPKPTEHESPAAESAVQLDLIEYDAASAGCFKTLVSSVTRAERLVLLSAEPERGKTTLLSCMIEGFSHSKLTEFSVSAVRLDCLTDMTVENLLDATNTCTDTDAKRQAVILDHVERLAGPVFDQLGEVLERLWAKAPSHTVILTITPAREDALMTTLQKRGIAVPSVIVRLPALAAPEMDTVIRRCLADAGYPDLKHRATAIIGSITRMAEGNPLRAIRISRGVTGDVDLSALVSDLARPAASPPLAEAPAKSFSEPDQVVTPLTPPVGLASNALAPAPEAPSSASPKSQLTVTPLSAASPPPLRSVGTVVAEPAKSASSPRRSTEKTSSSPPPQPPRPGHGGGAIRTAKALPPPRLQSHEASPAQQRMRRQRRAALVGLVIVAVIGGLALAYVTRPEIKSQVDRLVIRVAEGVAGLDPTGTAPQTPVAEAHKAEDRPADTTARQDSESAAATFQATTPADQTAVVEMSTAEPEQEANPATPSQSTTASAEPQASDPPQDEVLTSTAPEPNHASEPEPEVNTIVENETMTDAQADTAPQMALEAEPNARTNEPTIEIPDRAADAINSDGAVADGEAILAARQSPQVRVRVNDTPTESPEQLQAWIDRGDAFLEIGDITSARSFYRLAAEAGSAAAAGRAGLTYDPLFQQEQSVVGDVADPSLALLWYKAGQAAGDSVAAERLNALVATLSQRAEAGDGDAAEALSTAGL